MVYHLIIVQDISPKIKISLFLLSACKEKLVSPPKIITLEPNPPVGNENFPRILNSMPYSEHFYLSMSSFLVNLTALDR